MPQALQNPLGWCWIVVLLVTVALRGKPTRRSAGVLAGLCLILNFFGGTPASAWLLARLERPSVGSATRIPRGVDAIVVLGGSHIASKVEPAGFKVNSAFDRVTTGLVLVDQGLSTNLVLGGGSGAGGVERLHDGEALQPWLKQRVGSGVRIHVLRSSLTTREEAVHLAELARAQGWQRIALVTSGSHLPRATAVFRGQGIEVEPVGCAFEGLARLDSPKRWSVIPNTGDLRLAGMWMHEQIGSLYYRLRGWTTD